MNGCYLLFVFVVSLRSLTATNTQREAGTETGEFPQYLPRENNADIEENKYFDSNSQTEEK